MGPFSKSIRRIAICGCGFLVLLTLRLQTSNMYRSPELLGITRHPFPRHIQTKQHQVDKNNVSSSQKTEDIKTDSLINQCQANRTLVFVKTHKTGSSTISTTFLRYADEKHLKVALPIFTHIFHEARQFHHRMVLSVGDMKQFDVLVNHARYNRAEMDQVVHKAIYVTVIRNPVHQLESAFSYFGMAKNLGLPDDNGLEAFLQHPEFYFFNHNYHMREQSWNGQIFDLGLDHEYHLNETVVDTKINALDQEIDLVMLKEYFDHSMVLLRRLLCWDWMDIVYIAKGVRAKRFRHVVTTALADKIRKWNSADVKLYDHFNRTFWRKVDEYGSTFYADLNYFQELNRNISSVCIDKASESNYDKRVDAHLLRSDAPDFCYNLQWEEVPYTRWIKWQYVCHKMLLPSFVLLFFICASAYLIRYWYCSQAGKRRLGNYERVSSEHAEEMSRA